jgi:hypothetical protein
VVRSRAVPPSPRSGEQPGSTRSRLRRTFAGVVRLLPPDPARKAVSAHGGDAVSQLHDVVLGTARVDRRALKRQRRALHEHDRLGARLAELHLVEDLLVGATRQLERGWMQHGWFTFVDESGSRRRLVGGSPRTARRIAPESVVSVCLVGAIVQAGGGPMEARSQLVQRSLDLTWHSCFRGATEPIRWCPSPIERAAHVMDLVSWNDHPGRTAPQAAALLQRARTRTRGEIESTRDLRGALSADR